MIGALVLAPPVFAGCPPFSAPQPGHENDEVVPCHCLPGFKLEGQQEKRCRPVKPQPEMRAMTPAECLQFDKQTKTGAENVCSSGFYDCLVADGMSSDSAGCAAMTLLLASERTRSNAAGALVTCGQQAQAAWRNCTAAWDRCSLDAARTYEANVKRCGG